MVVVAGALSALLANDIVCLAVAPLLVEGCARRGLAPVPFLLALACAANVGSAATLIGNPQNMLIGQTLRLSFAGFLADALVPAVLGLAVVWGAHPPLGPRPLARPRPPCRRWTPRPSTSGRRRRASRSWSCSSLGFLFTPVPREVLALAGPRRCC